MKAVSTAHSFRIEFGVRLYDRQSMLPTGAHPAFPGISLFSVYLETRFLSNVHVWISDLAFSSLLCVFSISLILLCFVFVVLKIGSRAL